MTTNKNTQVKHTRTQGDRKTAADMSDNKARRNHQKERRETLKVIRQVQARQTKQGLSKY